MIKTTLFILCLMLFALDAKADILTLECIGSGGVARYDLSLDLSNHTGQINSVYKNEKRSHKVKITKNTSNIISGKEIPDKSQKRKMLPFEFSYMKDKKTYFEFGAIAQCK